jgi:hypothetical protein
MHKLGYSYLPSSLRDEGTKGRQIVLQISESTNKHRYTTNLNQEAKLPSPESINEILSLPAPFDISSGCSHLELAKKFARERGSRKGFTVYIFDADLGGKQIIGSPFSTYGAGHEALGLKAGSRIIGRYIDTGKMYKGRYTFVSALI